MRKQHINHHTKSIIFTPLGEVRWGLLFAIVMLLASCNDEAEVVSLVGDPNLELRSIDAVISTSATRATRATANNDYIGRKTFASGDRMVLTKMQRTSKPLVGFSYAGVNYGYSGSAWDRAVDGDGNPTDGNPERIFWSDNASTHTFIGYAIPQAWGKPDEVQTYGKWVNKEGIYSGQFTYTTEGDKKIVDFSSIPADIKDIKDKDNKVIGSIDSTGTNLKKEDLLLTHSTLMHADPGGLTTTLHYRHALASLRVIIDIQGFAPSTYSEDVKTTVDALVVLNQPYKYTWHSAITGEGYTMADGTAIPGWGVANSTIDADGTVDIKTWQPRPQGEGNGQAKVFTFYSLIVPGKQNGFTIKYKVHYPKYLNPTETQTKDYQAQLLDENNQPVTINFLPGYTTTIKVSLNHEGEPVYIGAEYIDWENVETPDRSELQKIDIFLDTDKRADVTIAVDDNATKDDATWLYKNSEGNVVDIYGNDGTSEHPYLIKTASQLLSFAYEVKSGRMFTAQYITLDSDIYLQKTLTDTDITWPGVGDDTKDSDGKYIHAFEGVFLGGGRYIHYLNGQPFFNVIGDYAVVDKVNFDKVINVEGKGVVANVNNGLICGCNVEGNVTQANPGSGESYCGSIVGDNQSFIVACTHVGDVAGYGYVGGLVGRNAGALVASYHSGLVAYGTGATDDQQKGIGGSTGDKDPVKSIIFSCYQNGDLITHDPNLLYCRAAWPLTTLQMQSETFVSYGVDDVSLDNIFDIPTSTPTEGDTYSPYIEGAQYHYSLNKALQKFSQWVNGIANQASSDGRDVELPCHTFTARQVQVLNALFSKDPTNGNLDPAHLYKYSPGTYPKIQ